MRHEPIVFGPGILALAMSHQRLPQCLGASVVVEELP